MNGVRLIVEQFDPERPKPGGIDTCIRGLLGFAPDDQELAVVGVDATGTKKLGQWSEHRFGDRVIRFMPVARLDNADLTRRMPHSVRLALGLRRYRPEPDAAAVQAHRLNIGYSVLRQFPRARHVQFIHSSGVENLGEGSRSFFKRAVFAYRALERGVIPRMDDVVVFSRSGAERLSALGNQVRFSPTWFDPVSFRPATRRAPQQRILWAARIEPAKDPALALDVLARLPAAYTMTIAGGGTLAAQMSARAHELGLEGRVEFLGPVDKARMGAVMREHDLLLMTSRFEGFSRSIVEALACGLPVVTPPGGEPNGLVVEGMNGARGADASELADAVLRAASMSPEAARSSVELLSARIVVPEVLQF